MKALIILSLLVVPMLAQANSRVGTLRSVASLDPETEVRLMPFSTVANSRTGTMKIANDQVRFEEKLSSGEIRFQVATVLDNPQTFVVAPKEFTAAEQAYVKALIQSKALQASGAAGWVEVASDRQGGGGL